MGRIKVDITIIIVNLSVTFYRLLLTVIYLKPPKFLKTEVVEDRKIVIVFIAGIVVVIV